MANSPFSMILDRVSNTWSQIMRFIETAFSIKVNKESGLGHSAKVEKSLTYERAERYAACSNAKLICLKSIASHLLVGIEVLFFRCYVFMDMEFFV